MKKTSEENAYFKSSDLALCATLCTHGYNIENIDRQNPKKIVFIIKKDKRLDNLIQKYWTHQLKVEPLSFFNFLKEIKTRIYNT